MLERSNRLYDLIPPFFCRLLLPGPLLSSRAGLEPLGQKEFAQRSGRQLSIANAGWCSPAGISRGGHGGRGNYLWKVAKKLELNSKAGVGLGSRGLSSRSGCVEIDHVCRDGGGDVSHPSIQEARNGLVGRQIEDGVGRPGAVFGQRRVLGRILV